MYFQLPSAGFLQKAFMGGWAWRGSERNPMARRDGSVRAIAKSNVSQGSLDGYLLEMVGAKGSSYNSKASLIDMHGDVVHKWEASFSRIWPDPPHLQGHVEDSEVCFFGGRVYPNGDILVVFHDMATTLRGCGLVKLDRDSNVLWKYSANVHHDVDIGIDGTIYAVQQQNMNEMPAGLEHIRPPCIADHLVLLTPDGREAREPISILEAFRDSPYSVLLSTIEGWPEGETAANAQAPSGADILHTNFVHVLSDDLAPHFPMFKAGQVLISVRELDAIAVLDPDNRCVVWAARGPWRRQHDAQFLPNGHLLIFDNLGAQRSIWSVSNHGQLLILDSLRPLMGARVLEYDPQTQAFPWSYSGGFHCPTRGMVQRLPNGNTLVVDSEGGRILEVTPGKDLAWSCSCPGFVQTARWYSSDQLPFLKDDRHRQR